MICETVPKDPAVVIDLGDMEQSPEVGEYLQHSPGCCVCVMMMASVLIDHRVFSSLSELRLLSDCCSGNITEIIDPRPDSTFLSLFLTAVPWPGPGSSLFWTQVTATLSSTATSSAWQWGNPRARIAAVSKLRNCLSRARSGRSHSPAEFNLPLVHGSSAVSGAVGWFAVANVPLPQHCHRHSPHSLSLTRVENLQYSQRVPGQRWLE